MNQPLTEDQLMQQVMSIPVAGIDWVGLLIPVALFTAIAVVFVLNYYYRYKTRHDLQKTVQAVVERGQELTPELLDRLGQPANPVKSDLRRGVFLVSIGLAMGVLGFMVDDADAVRPMLGIAMFPFISGIAYLGLWHFGDERKEQNPGA